MNWIAESLVQFSKSPLWRTPVNNFIDENCYLFDGEEEMKLEYTTIHKKFIALIDTLLTDFLEELGVSLADAVGALAESSDSGDGNEKKMTENLLKYIYSVDDFRTFYLMMVQRNLALDLLASEALRAQGIYVGADESPEMAGSPDPAGAQRFIQMNGDVDEEEALRQAIAASLANTSAPEQQQKALAYENAKLQETLHNGIRTEEKKAEVEKKKVEQQVQQLSEHDLHAAEKLREERYSVIEQEKHNHIHALQDNTLCATEENRRQQRQVLAASEVASPTATKVSQEPQATAAPAPAVPVPIHHVGQSALPSIARVSPLPSPAASTPSPTPASGTASTAPPAPSSAPQPSPPTKEELEARAKYMREQRAKILAQKKASRDTELEAYAKNKAPTTSGASSANATDAEKALAVEIARRFREDLIGEGRRKSTPNA